MRFLRWLAVCAVVALAAPLFAQSEDAVARAKELHAEAAEKFRAGEFKEARELFEQAYALDPHPTLIYNVARACENLRDFKCAVKAYKEYLRIHPDAPDRGAVEQLVVKLDAEIAKPAPRPSPPRPPPPKPPPPPEPRTVSPIPWIIVGVGAAGLVAGIVLGAVAATKHDQAVDEPSALRSEELAAEADTLGLAANVCFGAGGAVALGGLIAGLVDVLSGSDDSAQLRFEVRF